MSHFRRRRHSWFVLAVAFGLVLALPPAAESAVQADAQWQGDQLISWGSIDVQASPETAFAVLTDYDRMASFIPSVESSRLVSREGSVAIVEQHVEESLMFFRQSLDVRLAVIETPSTRLTIKALAGSFRSLQASYELSPWIRRGGAANGTAPPTGAWTRIRYRSRFVPDFDLPAVVGPYLVERSLKRYLEALSREIDRRADAGRVATPPGN